MNPDQNDSPTNYQPPRDIGSQSMPPQSVQQQPLSQMADPLAQPQPTNDPYASVIYGGAGAPRKSKKKKIVLWSSLVLLLALGGAGFVFGYYLPNKPENVWKTGLNRTGEALQKTVTTATEKSRMDSFAKSQVSADARFTSADSTVTGTLATTYDERKQNGNLDVTIKQTEQPDKVFGAKFLSELKEGSLYPSLYFQLNGLKSLGIEGLEVFFPGISEYDGKWIAVEEDYIRSVTEEIAKAKTDQPEAAQPTPAEPKKEEPVSSEDVAELARTTTGVLGEYLLTTEPTKAVFEQRKFIGKETVEGMKTYRFQVAINKAHAKDFCKAMVERVYATAIGKKTIANDPDQQVNDKAKESRTKECQDSVENDIKQDETFDLWIDTKYKLVHKIRAYSDDKKTYADIGQTYKGGDDLSLFVIMHEDEDPTTDDKLTLDTNLKSGETKVALTMKSAKEGDVYDLSAALSAKPYTEEIKIEKPAGAVPVKSIFERYGIDPAALTSLVGGSTAEPEYTESDLPTASTQPIIYQN